MMNTKPGIKSTEFYLLLLGFAYAVLSGLEIDNNFVTFKLDLELAKWWLGAVIAYVGARGYVKGKNGTPPAAGGST